MYVAATMLCCLCKILLCVDEYAKFYPFLYFFLVVVHALVLVGPLLMLGC
jgi:hypothetical protein